MTEQTTSLLRLIDWCGPWVDSIEARQAPQEVVGYLRALLARERTKVLAPSAIIFRRLDEREWLIHRSDDEPRRYRCDLVGLTAAWNAIRNREIVLAADYAAPSSAHADHVVRIAIRRTAGAWVERATGCTALAAAMRGMRVVGGVVTYEPSRSVAHAFDTGD